MFRKYSHSLQLLPFTLFRSTNPQTCSILFAGLPGSPNSNSKQKDSLNSVLQELKKKKNPLPESPKSLNEQSAEELQRSLVDSTTKDAASIIDTNKSIENQTISSAGSAKFTQDFQKAMDDVTADSQKGYQEREVEELKKQITKLSSAELNQLLDNYEKNHGKALEFRATKRLVTEVSIFGVIMVLIWKISSLKNEHLEYVDEKEAELSLIRGRIHQLQSILTESISKNADIIYSRAMSNLGPSENSKLEPLIHPIVDSRAPDSEIVKNTDDQELSIDESAEFNKDIRGTIPTVGMSIAQDVSAIINASFDNIKNAETLPKMMGKAELDAQSYYIGIGRLNTSGSFGESIEGSTKFATSLLTPPHDFVDPFGTANTPSTEKSVSLV